MFSRVTTLFLTGIFLLTAFAGCDRKQPLVPIASSEAKTVDDRFAIKVGERLVSMQVAARPDEMQKGLMYRQSMGEDEGMVFVFAKPQRMSFWMRNTEIPLDIGYFDVQGVLKEIHPLYPHDENAVKSRSQALQFCLEMNQGWYARNGVKPGAQLDLKALAAALRARGLKAEELGLPST